MPVYNGERYIKQSIDSILDQTFEDFELLIINDGSTDSTEDIILSYQDKRIVYVKNNTNIQLVDTLNKGIDLAQGKFIARMDADDISYPTRLEQQIDYLMRNEDSVLVGSWAEVINEQGKIVKYRKPAINHSHLKAELFFYNNIVHSSVTGKTEVFREFKYNNNFPCAEDYHLWMLMANKYPIANLPEYLIQYRLHEENIVQLKQNILQQSVKKILEIQLSKLGISLSKEDMEKHFLLCYSYHDYHCLSKLNFYEANEWLIFLKKINDRKKIYVPSVFNKKINLFYKIKLTLLWSSKLAYFHKFFDKIIFKIKAIK